MTPKQILPYPDAIDDSDFADVLWRAKDRYDENGRHYHTWTHIEQIFDCLRNIETKIHYRDAIFAAAYFHDAIYKVPSATNEEESATLMRSELSPLLDERSTKLANEIILATKTHDLPESLNAEQTSDCKHFLDADMSILAASEPEYAEYASGVRKEYLIVPDALYVPARIDILKGFLERPRIYLTDYFFAEFEKPARRNITREIAELQGQSTA